jgi:hypothetical protein
MHGAILETASRRRQQIVTDVSEEVGDSEETSWQAWFVPEKQMREAHLAALPGKEHYERFDALNRASRVFGTNGAELERHLGQFLGTDVHVDELDDEFAHEAVRLLHNYLASVTTLRDVQRAIHHRLWPKRAEPDNPENTKTLWEVTVYGPRTEFIFGDDAVKFLYDLRNFTVHYALPPVSSESRISFSAGNPVVQVNSVRLKRDDLVKFKRWSAAAKRYLRSVDGDVDFVAIIERYSILARMFYGWFWRQVRAVVGVDVDEFVRKSNEYGLWLAELNAGPDWDNDADEPMPIPGSMFKHRAHATIARAALGTSGWRTIEVDSAGAAIIGESNWDPLPKFRRQLT